MNPDGCPQCGEVLAAGAAACHDCGWTADRQRSGLNGPITALAIMVSLLMITGSCAFRSYAAPYGDEFGYGKAAILESAVLIATIVWLGVGLSLRSTVPRSRKLAVIRASAGVSLGVFACVVALYHNAGESNDMVRSLLLASTGFALFVSSYRVLKPKA